MPHWSFHRLALVLAGLSLVPALTATILGAKLAPHEARPLLWTVMGVVMGLALVASVLAAWLWQRRLNRQVDGLIEHCHQLALAEPGKLAEWPLKLADLGRLGMAIQVLREALVDYLSIYRRFFEAAPDMFLTLSPAGGRILDANQAFCQKVGRLRSEVLGQAADQFLTLESGWEPALKGGGGLMRGQVEGPGGVIQIEATISLEPGSEGQPWVLGAILRDVTQREDLHRELVAKSAALEHALEEIRSVEELKDQFLTTLSHELKTPLVSLKGFMQMIRQGRGSPEDTGRYLDICWRNLGKLESQINNLLDLARLSHAKEQYEMAPVELAGLVRTAAENLRPAAAERKVSLDLGQVADSPVMVLGHEEKLVQLVDNLLVNAVKYNKEQGEVGVCLQKLDDQVNLEVTDSGVGMDREQMAKIFNRFYRADITGTGRLEGLGIGLSLVQEIVKLHQGDIRVDSQPGQGTTFSVLLRPAP